LCALAVLVVESCDAAVRRRESRELATNWAIAAVAASLSIVLLLTMVGHVRLLLGEPEKWSSLDRTSRVRPEDVRALRSIRKMDRWMKTNVPEGEKVFVVATYDDYQAFLDGGRHEWASLQFDCKVGRRNLTGNGCVPGEAIAEAPPKPTVWFSMEEDCRAIALSTPTLMKQMEQNNSDYLLVSDQSWYPAISGSVPYLSNSGAFEIAHAERSGEQKRTGSTQAFVLLKRTEEVPHPTPTRMSAETVNRLVKCEKSEGSKSAQEVRSKFPNGIALVPTSGRGPKSDDEAKINARANKAIEEIFR